MQTAGPNAEQITYWNETAGPKWVTLQEVLDAQIEPLGLLAMDRAGVRPGERVLDVGCGTGQTSLELARRVGPTGSVTGLDISAPMLARARERAHPSVGAGVTFVQADAQTHRFEDGGFDLVFSRFGVMFFADPTAAFTNLRAALRTDGRLGFVCWQALPENPWMFVPLMAAAQHLALPPPPGPDAPGPFSFADADRVRGILERAGFHDVACEEHRATLTVGGTGPLDRAIEFLLQMGPAAALLRDVDAATRGRVGDAVRDALAPYHTPAGVRMASAAWIVSAHLR